MKIAICFRGISRSLNNTISSIRDNIIHPAGEFGEVKIFTHFYNQATIDNPRSGENGNLNVEEYRLLRSDWLTLEDPNTCLAIYNFESLKTFGDPWNDNFSSLRNLIHALHSLKQGWLAAKEWSPDLYIFVRPDLDYHDSFSSVLNMARRNRRKGLWLPLWQSWWGCNDRFAVADSPIAAETYASRIDRALEYCINTKNSLHSERFLYFCLQGKMFPLWFTNIKASRTRSNGSQVKEDFKIFHKSNFNALLYALQTRLYY